MKSVLIVLVLLCEISIAKIRLHELVPICDATKPNLNDCVVKSANLMIPNLVNGIEELKVPSIDPLQIQEMDVSQSNQPISLKLKFIQTTQKGLSTLKFYSASMDLNKNRWILNATLPYFAVVGKYKGTGRILLIPMIGEGKANLTMLNMNVDFVLDGNRKKANDDVIFNLTNLKVYFKFDKCFISITDLFSGSKQLSEVLYQFIANNSREVMDGMKGTLEKIYSALYFDLTKKLLSNIPYSDIFGKV